MNREELAAFLKEHLVPSKLYYLGDGHKKNRICLNSVNDLWEVYFSDKKEKVGLARFATENEACNAMVEELNKVMQALYGLKFV